MMKKYIIIAIIIFGVFYIYNMYNKPHTDIAETSVEISISAGKIVEDFSLHETIANRNYLDKIIAVKGVISDTKIENNKGIVSLKSNDDFGSVLCYLSTESTRKISLLKVGDTIVVKGVCTGYLMDVVLIKSEIHLKNK
jgi:DNA/RNA endonuclease YhcR with UshA esterase domain